jgi:hypothetical protein
MTNSETLTPFDRNSFNRAMAEVLHDHATLRHLADVVGSEPDLCTDIALSMADVMVSHERAEARLFELPFMTRTPGAVESTAAMARRRCIEFTSGDCLPTGGKLAADQFIDALMAHLAAEESWFDQERERRNEYLRIIA